MRFGSILALAGLLIATMLPAAYADDANDIDLKLFGENVTDGWEGCQFSLWQKNRDPATNKYAYVFFAPIPDGEALPGWVKIGDQIIEIEKADIGSADTGMLEPFRLYKSPDGNLTVMMEILDQSRSDRGIEVHDARLTFIAKDKFPFPVRVKGLNGCPGAAEISDAVESAADSSGSGLRLGRERQYDSLNQIPKAVMRAVADYGSLCEPHNTPGYSSSYEISSAMTLWQVPCNLFGYSASSLFVTSFAHSPDFAEVLSFPRQPGATEADMIEALNAMVTPGSGMVEMSSVDSGGDCGEYWEYALVLAPGEVVEFELREYRNKTRCDGVETDPSMFPLVYQSR